MESFEEYLNSIDNLNNRYKLESILNWVRDNFPQLDERIAWNQPMFTDHGTYIIGFSISKNHISVSPEQAGIEYFADDISKAGYSYSKMIFRIKWTDPVDYPLLDKMIQYNIEDKTDYTSFWRK